MGNLVLSGATSGATTLTPTDATTQTITFPSGNGTVITTGSSGKVIPTAALPAGTVLQVVQGTVSGDTSTTSTSYVSTGLYATITPTSATSKIAIFVASNISFSGGGGTSLVWSIYRGTSGAGSGSLIGADGVYLYGPQGVSYYQPTSYNYVDSPGGTSAYTYTVMHRSTTGGTAGFCYGLSAGDRATIILMEIAA